MQKITVGCLNIKTVDLGVQNNNYIFCNRNIWDTIKTHCSCFLVLKETQRLILAVINSYIC
ncbi:hypothetical protein LPBF_04970 [Flavobacterium crassostreae]|uniref:Uncharacterized protein n=1 Tax=Flavobacterium crassostreae TaxID=1763534 RepID=A0A1B9E5Y3_9FLAO|nr:hypothetical protein LPBF_04970 [Flavobacterium crassostreae]